MYNFDEIIDRKNTDCIKYDFAVERGLPEDVLPLWVADMDIRAPKEVNDAIIEAAKHGIYGYSETKDDYFEILSNWFKNFHNWEIKKDWLVKTPGVVFAIATAIRALTEEGDGILIQEPVYYPFSNMIEENNRRLINNSLLYKDGRYNIDFEDFEKKIKEENVKLFIFCNPHNPVGRVWEREIIERLGKICLDNNVIVLSDEIHSDLVYEGYEHHVFANINNEFRDNCIVFTAPSKTFNIAGLQVSNIFIPNEDIRNRFKSEMNRAGYSQLNTLGLVAAKAAYKYGHSWLKELKKYLWANIEFVEDYLKENIPEVKLVKPEGTYLIWLDFRDTGLNNDEIEDLIINKAKLWLDGGTMFGEDGEKFQRINIACPRKTVEEALDKIKLALYEK
ncbi:MAG: MalY/PatB family protein [Andreesenia angusta]|nr:MalY/PatB family protein [Andreesenia angusta]